MRITAQLIHGASDEHLWDNEYEGDLTDILSLQKNIARAIASEIGLALRPEEETYLASAPQVNPEAYQLYQEGWYYRQQESPESVQRAMEYLERSVELDSAFALAWANLGIVYSLARNMGLVERTEAVSKAHDAVERALALDPDLAEAHVNKGIFISYTDFENMTAARIAEAEAAFQRGLALNPGLLDAQFEYGMFLNRFRGYDEAIPHFLKLQELSPLTFHANYGLGLSYRGMGRLEEACDYLQKAHDLEPSASIVANALALTRVTMLHKQERYEELLSEAQASGNAEALMIAYRGLNEPDLAAALFDSLRTSYQQEGRLKIELAYLHTVYGDREGALTLLEESCAEEMPVQGSAYMRRYHFVLWELHDEPRYQVLMAQADAVLGR